ncbi:MAG: lamin tail domain-containing protein [Polyangiaceae bacterium]|nr:lamin tail domain-containing protein [Polyangiaceae bacterium]
MLCSGAGVLAGACTDPLPELPPAERGHGAAGTAGLSVGDVVVSLEPPALLDRAAPVSWIRVGAEDSAAVVPEELYLFRGELSEYHLGRLARRDLPQTLLDRRVPAVAFAVAEGSSVIAPSVRLTTAEPYCLVTPGLGVLALITVDDANQRPALRREWPIDDWPTSARRSLHCAPLGAALDRAMTTLQGSHGKLRVGPWPADAREPRCAVVEVEDELEVGAVVPLPPAIAGFAVSPAPLVHAEQVLPEPCGCVEPEVAVGPACLTVLDDRLNLRGPNAPIHALFTPGEAGAAILPGETLVVPGLIPGSAFSVLATLLLPNGEVTEVPYTGVTGAAEPHVVLNEVLANAVGAEPAAEWVEIFNDGTETVSLEGYTVADLAAEVELPPASLPPGAFALVVSEGYAPDPEVDAAPSPGTLLLRVPRLGQGGLANRGELLRLRSPDGVVRSRFPARAADEAGTSIARRAPWLADDVASAFGPHAAPGASPGAANVLIDAADGAPPQ